MPCLQEHFCEEQKASGRKAGVSYQIATFAANMVGVSVNGTAVVIEMLPSDEK